MYTESEKGRRMKTMQLKSLAAAALCVGLAYAACAQQQAKDA